MPTTPLTASRVPDLTYAADLAQIISQTAVDLEDNTTPNFATTAARDTAYANWVAAGNTMRNGLSCWCDTPGAFFDRIGGAWVQRGLLPYAKIGQSTDLTQGVASNWLTVPLQTLTTEGPATFTTDLRNNTAYPSHPARNVLIIGRSGLYHFDGHATYDAVGVNTRLIRNPAGTIETLAANPSGGSSGQSAVSATVRCAAGDAIALQSFYSTSYIARGDTGATPMNINATRIGD